MKKTQYIAPEIDVLDIGSTQMCAGSDVIVERAQETDPDYYVEDDSDID
ncbi:MAG: hypothetical protein KBS65_03595 [Prevotella sp.]|nr:hypothetical protein [Candidatus Equicola stercoris]